MTDKMEPVAAIEAAEARHNFTEWLAREMPPGTVISDPRWWAPKIIRAFTDYRTLAEAANPPAQSAQQPSPARGGADERKLIGWRTGDYLHETADRDKALNWIGNVEVLPIFEGDPNTKLQAAALPAVPEGFVLVPKVPTDDMLRAMRKQRSGAAVGTGDRALYAAMLAAAPSAATGEGVEG